MSLRIYGNRLLKTLPGLETRPTPAKVREAIFNTWQGRVEGCRWLDLCAGSGAMGAEALCRGAGFVVGIEKHPRACSLIQENWQKTGRSQFRLLCGDVVQGLAKLSGEKFDLVYFDPPYQSKLYQPVLEAIACYHLLALHGAIAVEHAPNLPPPPKVLTLQCDRQKKYGNTTISFYQLVEPVQIN